MLEVEMKFPVADLAALEARLARGGAGTAAERRDADHYFNAPDRDFARTDEALRVRTIGPANFVTYKGPKRDPLTKTRTEIEVPLGDGVTVREGHLDLRARLPLRPALGALVGDEVGPADAAQAEGLVGAGEVAVRGVEVVIGLGDAGVGGRPPLGQAPLRRGEVGPGELHLDFEHAHTPRLAPVHVSHRAGIR